MNKMIENLLNAEQVLKAPLSLEIKKEYDRLIKLIVSIPFSERNLKKINGTGGKVSVTDLIAYQIGWGKCLICWYESGLKMEAPEMPGEGFSKWDYVAIAQHFYAKYQYDQNDQQVKAFHQVVFQLLDIVENENQTGHLDQIGIWTWCTLLSGKHWPLSKWIRINSCAPYKRAYHAIKKCYHL
ncbi:MAG: ClbS/DfsB family four-helix bundle protein [Parachlamydiaceae bacterium]|nr:ClbS/DfsB family four-helix bundle protein [Parachlamydiaceae bacterium]